MSEESGWLAPPQPQPQLAPGYIRTDSEGSGWMPAPQPVGPVAQVPQQAVSPGFGGMMPGMGRGGKSAMPPDPPPQWSAASYEPSQFQNRPQAAPQQPWGGGRQMPQQFPGAPRQMPQQGNPMVRALRGQ